MPTNVCIAISSKTLRAMLDYQEEQEAGRDPDTKERRLAYRRSEDLLLD